MSAPQQRQVGDDDGGGPAPRVPPQDVEAERAVLGGMMSSKDAIADVVEILKPADFYRPAHSTIFNTILTIYGHGDPADAITVASALLTAGDLTRVGGASYLHDLLVAVPTASNAGYYARIVAQQATLRRVTEAGATITRVGFDTGGRDADQVVDFVQQTVYDLTERQRSSSDLTPLADLMQPTLDEIEAAGSTKGQMRGVPTGFGDLDRLLQGLQAGQLVVIGGRAGLGKTTAAADMVRACSIKHGHQSAVFSLEMGKTEVVTRMLSAEAKVNLSALRSGVLTDDEWSRLARTMGRIGEAPIFIDDTPSMTLMEIRAKARRLAQTPAGLKLVVVDYLQLMTSATRVENRQQEIAALSRGLKLLAKEIGCAVIAVSQLNRGPDQRTDKRPQMSDLRESGAIEQDADVVILLHREDYYDKESPRAGEADFIVAKHRNGPTDTITVAAQLHFSRFVDMAISSGPI